MKHLLLIVMLLSAVSASAQGVIYGHVRVKGTAEGVADANIMLQDEQGRVYVLYPVKEIMEDMNRSEASVSKYLAELEEAKLLERVQSAPGRPCKLYLKKLSYACEV